MSQPWNLTPTEWSDVLLSDASPKLVAKRIHTDLSNPWGVTLLDYTKDSKTILDLGSGRGQHSATLALAGKQMTLADWSKENIGFSVELFGALKIPGSFCLADMLKPLPFKDRAFDSVFSCGVFEYFSDQEICQILTEMFRIADKRVIIMVPNSYSIAYRIGKYYQEKTGAWKWGGERPFGTMKPYFKAVGSHKIEELSIGAKTSLDFLTMRGSGLVKRAATSLLNLTDHPGPSLLRQGYLLMSVAEKP